jgi:hypothetical protein
MLRNSLTREKTNVNIVDVFRNYLLAAERIQNCPGRNVCVG